MQQTGWSTSLICVPASLASDVHAFMFIRQLTIEACFKDRDDAV